MPKCEVFAAVAIVMMLVAPTPAFAQQARTSCEGLPANLLVDEPFRNLVADLVARSATLQRQCLALASASGVHVTIVSPIRLLGDCRARATFVRVPGLLRALVEIPIGSDFAELLAHELEHVLEQIEGLDLPVLARIRESGVRDIGRNTYETVRATAAGRAATLELADRTVVRVQAAVRPPAAPTAGD